MFTRQRASKYMLHPFKESDMAPPPRTGQWVPQILSVLLREKQEPPGVITYYWSNPL